MIVKILDDKLQDKHLVEAAYLKWDYTNEGYAILEVHAISNRTETVGSVSASKSLIEDKPSLRLRIHHGDRIFFMNNQGQTVDSKRVILDEEKEGKDHVCEAVSE